MSFTKFNSLAEERDTISCACWAKAAAWVQALCTAWLKSYTNTTESSESVWAAAVHSAFFITSKKGLEQHMKQRIVTVRKVCMEPSSTATEQLTAKYLQHALLANLNNNDASRSYHNASSVCYR